MADLLCPTKSSTDVPPSLTIPDDLTLAHFILEGHRPTQPQTSSHNSPCLIEEESGRLITLEELRSRTASLAYGLRSEYDIGQDDVVLIASPNHVDYPVVVWAVHYLGATVTLSNPNFTVDELAYHIRLTQPSLIIAHSSTLHTIRTCIARMTGLTHSHLLALGHPSDRIPSVEKLILNQKFNEASRSFQGVQRTEGLSDKVAALCLSSGTTGLPKAVRITHRALMANILQMAIHTRNTPGLRPGDVALGVLPFYHAAGLVINLHFFLFCGVSVVVVPRYDLPRMLDLIPRFGITTLILVPPQAISLCKHPNTSAKEMSSVRYVIIGAAPVPKEVQHSLQEVFPDAQIGQAYGTTETTCTIAMHSSQKGPPGNAGKILPGVEVRVLKENGLPANIGELGELYVRSPSIALGYLNNDAANRETFKDFGWMRTGDQVSITRDGHIFVHDRIKEFIKVKGFQVAPAELEGCILDHPEVADVCVIGIPDPSCGEVPRAFVVLSASARRHKLGSVSNSILEHVESRKSSYKHLKGGVEFVSSIPKTGSGKILRRTIRNDYMKRLAKL